MLIIVGVLTYFVSPFDVLPEAVLGLVGLIDDFCVLLGGLVMLANRFNAVLQMRNERAIEAR